METDRTQSTRSAATISVVSGESNNFRTISDGRQSTSGMASSSSSGSNIAMIWFTPTLLCLISLGIVHYLIYYMFIGYPRLHGFLQLVLAYFGWEWYDLYGARLTRTERFFFDEKNILATSSGFDFNSGPVLEDTTPGGSGGCCGKYPSAGLIKTLMADPKEAEMQAFYKQHYGNMYDIARRASKEAKAAEAISSPTIASSDSLITVKTGASSYVTASSKASDSDESQKSSKKK